MYILSAVKKKYMWALVGASLSVSLLVYLIFFQDRITAANYERIQRGMTETDVNDILGRRADLELAPMWDISRPQAWPIVRGAHTKDDSWKWEKVWHGRYSKIVVYFDSEDKVCNKRLLEADDLHGPLMTRLLKLLGI
jgi:hypothetical protein